MEIPRRSYVGERLNSVRKDLMPLFPSKSELIALGIKDMLMSHKEVDWYSKIVASGRILGETAGLFPFEADVMTVWFLKKVTKLAYAYKDQMGFAPQKTPKMESDEELVLIFVDAIGTASGRDILGEENANLRGWIFSLKDMADGLAQRIISKDFNTEEMTAFMGEKLRDSITARQPVEDLVSPILEIQTNIAG